MKEIKVFKRIKRLKILIINRNFLIKFICISIENHCDLLIVSRNLMISIEKQVKTNKLKLKFNARMSKPFNF